MPIRSHVLLHLHLGVLCCTAELAFAGSPVAEAAARGDLEAVRTLLQNGADVNAPQGDGMTALHWAAERDAVEMVQTLVAAGATLETTTRIGAYTPLHLASRAGSAKAVAALLKAGGNPKAVSTAGGATPLHLAAAAGSVAAIRALLDRGAVIDARESAAGQTPLMFAASYGRVATVEVLLERGADHTIATEVVDLPARRTADQAMRRRRNQVVAATKAKGSAPTPGQVQAAIRAARQLPPQKKENQEKPTPEAAVDYEEVRPKPLTYTELVGKQGGLTALLHAAREGHSFVVEALLAAGAEIDRVSGGDRTSPMLIAMINGHFDLAMRLLDRGADPNLASDSGATPLYAALNAHWAPKARYPQQQAYKQQKATYLDVMARLLKAGVDPNVRLKKHLWYMSYTFDLLGVDTRGATPFWRAAYATDVDAMRLLVAHGADPKIATQKVERRRSRRGGRRGERGRGRQRADRSGLPSVPAGGPAVYPIHAASGVGYGEGYAGNSHRHVPGGWLPAVRYLVEELGADVNARDHNGYSPLHHAAARGDDELIRYLVEKAADVTVVSRRGQTTADMANGPVQRVQVFPETVALLQRLGAKKTPK